MRRIGEFLQSTYAPWLFAAVLVVCAAAASGYGFAIAAPTCVQVPFEEQTRFFDLLKTHYELRSTEPNFGQNATTLLVLTRRDAQKGTKE